MNIGCILQARTGSKRFPGKIYTDINGKYTLQRVLENVSKSIVPHQIILAMPLYDKAEFMKRFKAGEFNEFTDRRFSLHFGEPDNVLKRYYDAANEFGIDLVVRITCDCPLICSTIIDEMLIEYLKNNYNGFMGNNETVSFLPYPDGTDVEIFPYWMLAEAHILSSNEHDKEHVTPFMYRRGTPYKIYPFLNCRPNSIISMKLPNFSFDTQADYSLIKEIVNNYDNHEDLNRAIKEVK